SSWPMWLWLSFVLPIPPAVWMFVTLKRTGRMTYAWKQTARIFLMFCLILIGALLAAGITYASAAIVQASLYRFSIYPKLLSCVAIAFALDELAARPQTKRTIASLATATGALLMLACLHLGPYLGLFSVAY